MQIIKTLSLTPDANNWLMNSRHPRILHVFDQACNLINERREVLSVVTPQIGNGPFNLVIEDDILFSECLDLQSPVSYSPTQITLGNMTINTTSAKLWLPRPDWEELHRKKDAIFVRLSQLQITNSQACGLPLRGLRDTDWTTPALASGAGVVQSYSTTTRIQSLISSLSQCLVNADLPSAVTLAAKLAGLGNGLTPAGDDFLMGALYAVWVIHPPEIASVFAREIAETAAPLTTSLSAAWLRSAGRGEAGILWHEFFDGLIAGDSPAIQLQITKLLSIGHTSGADALAGFMSAFISYAESETKPCHS